MTPERVVTLVVALAELILHFVLPTPEDRAEAWARLGVQIDRRALKLRTAAQSALDARAKKP